MKTTDCLAAAGATARPPVPRQRLSSAHTVIVSVVGGCPSSAGHDRGPDRLRPLLAKSTVDGFLIPLTMSPAPSEVRAGRTRPLAALGPTGPVPTPDRLAPAAALAAGARRRPIDERCWRY